MDKIGEVVLPGTTLCSISDLSNSYRESKVTKVELGPGLRRIRDPQTGGEIVQSTLCGALQHRIKIKRKKTAGGADRSKRMKHADDSVQIASFWIDAPTKRYEPRVGDRVVSIVLTTTHENARLSLGNCDNFGTLPRLAFENATKKNRPELNAGDCLFSRVVAARRDCEPELSCATADGRSSGFGVLHGAASVKQHGTMSAQCSALVRLNLRSTRSLLAISKLHSTTDSKSDASKSMPFPFELVVGANGVVFVSARSYRELHTVVRALRRTFLEEVDRPVDPASPEEKQLQSASAVSRFAKELCELADSMWHDAK